MNEKIQAGTMDWTVESFWSLYWTWKQWNVETGDCHRGTLGSFCSCVHLNIFISPPAPLKVSYLRHLRQ
jgi:hypothetical protein